VLLLLSLFACVSPDEPVDAESTETFVLEVPKGATANGLSDELISAGFVGSAVEWKLFLRQRDASCLKAGNFEVSLSMSLNQLVDTVCGPPIADDVPFTMLEGWRIRDTDAALARAGLIEAGAYIAVAEGKTVEAPFAVTSSTYEGYLYPETYMVPASAVDPGQLVARQLETFDRRFVSKKDDLGKRSLHEIVVMASMLEREEPNPDNRPLVAGILWKRIDTNNALGVDATSRYTIENWNDRSAFLTQLRDPDDPYNSRLRKGLPPTAIGAPTLESLEAAMNPTSSEYWYYLHDEKGNLHPGRNAAEHEALRKKYNVY
jgi:UPF0755 protein